MNLLYRFEDDICIITVEGELVIEQIKKFKAYATKLVPNNKGLVLNLNAVNFIDSAGIGAVMWSAKEAKQKKQEFAVCNTSDIVDDIFRSMGLYTMFSIFDTETKALHHITEKLSKFSSYTI
ncbi:MAG: STAS domain-containing protein [SAR324 cluster bacterium]|nr:STAS domain-containing protein [SAR324 cluster bacterium]